MTFLSDFIRFLKMDYRRRKPVKVCINLTDVLVSYIIEYYRVTVSLLAINKNI